MHPDDRLFGEIAIKLGMVQRHALAPWVKAILARPGKIAEVLLEAGLLTREQVVTVSGHFDRIVRERRSVTDADGFGEVPSVAPAPAPAQAPARASAPAAGARATPLEAPPREAPPREAPPREAPPREAPPREAATRSGEAPRRPPVAPPGAPSVAAAPSTTRLQGILQQAVERGASDIHVHSGAPILLRIAGRLEAVAGDAPLPRAAAEEIIGELLTPEQRQRVLESGQVDFACSIAGLARFRASAYRQHRGMDLVLRVIPEQKRSLAELGLPPSLARLLDFRTGLVLCTGPAGSGKSTTLAALLDALIAQRKEHVITLEDPIEHLFRAHLAWVNQRQVERHTESFARALRSALREDPDVIVVTELRDRETIGLALTAAETGHLVLSTVNTNSAGQTISRLVNAFPGEEQGHVRGMLSESLRAVISQRLVPSVDGQGRVPAVEVLIGTTAVANTIRDNKTFQLPSLMQTGTALGMVTLDDSLLALVEAGKIRRADAQKLATTKERFK